MFSRTLTAGKASIITHPISVPPWTSEQTAPGRSFWVMTLLTILKENQHGLRKKTGEKKTLRIQDDQGWTIVPFCSYFATATLIRGVEGAPFLKQKQWIYVLLAGNYPGSWFTRHISECGIVSSRDLGRSFKNLSQLKAEVAEDR